jgi:hypothetical protein
MSPNVSMLSGIRANSNKTTPRMPPQTPEGSLGGGSANCARKSATSPPAMAYRGRTRMGAANAEGAKNPQARRAGNLPIKGDE